FDVLNTVEFFGKRPERLCEQRQLIRVHGKLVGLRFEELTLGENDVTDVEAFVRLVPRISQLRTVNEDLHETATVADAKEGGLAKVTDRHHPTSDLRALGKRLHLFLGLLVVRSVKVLRQGVGFVA